MTSAAARLSTIERRLRLDPGHERCPQCDGTGLDDRVAAWWLELRPALDELRVAILARFPHLPDPTGWADDVPPDPMPAPVPCRVCGSTGRATLAAAAAHRDEWWTVWGPFAAIADRPRT